jgi:hypothetical protein
MAKQLMIPGLDHSLYRREGGLFSWEQEPGHITPKARAKNEETKSKYWRNPEQRKRQVPIWEDMA